MAAKVGSEVRSICGKCGDVWHVVVALAGGRIAQVECGDCGARHRYRTATGSRSGTARARKKAPEKKPLVQADTSRPRRPFSPKDTYEVGDRVVHPTFGEGVVQATLGPTKVEVLFESGPKRLVQGR